MTVLLKWLPFILSLAQSGASILVEKYRARRAEKEAAKAETERRLAAEARDAKLAVVSSEDKTKTP